MKKVLAIGTLVLIFMVSCNKKNTDKNLSKNNEDLQEVNIDKYEKRMEAPSFDFIVEAQNGESTNVKVRTKGLANEYAESISVEGQVKDSYMADLNGDGLHEFYVIVSPTDDSGNLDIFGFAVNNNETMSMITINKLTDKRDTNTDEIKLKNGKLHRMFKVDGVEKHYTYELLPGKASYILKAIETK